MLSLSLVPAVQ